MVSNGKNGLQHSNTTMSGDLSRPGAELQQQRDRSARWPPKPIDKPVFSCDAQVYQLDDSEHAKKSSASSDGGGSNTACPWTELTPYSVPVHVYYDNGRSAYRVICINMAKPVVNTTVNLSVIISKLSSKFVQWIDSKMKYGYGFGFTSDVESESFFGKIKEIQDEIRHNLITQGPATTPVAVAAAQPLVNGGDAIKSNSTDPQDQSQTDSLTILSGGDPEKYVDLLKQENEKLKIALSDSCGSVKKWKEKLDVLESQNKALRDCVFNSKDENFTVSQRVGSDSASSGGIYFTTAPDTVTDNSNGSIIDENRRLTNRVRELEKEKQVMKRKLSNVLAMVRKTRLACAEGGRTLNEAEGLLETELLSSI